MNSHTKYSLLMRRYYLLIGSLLVGGFNSYAQTHYTFTDLGTLGGSSSYAFDINNTGQVVGRSYYSAGSTMLHAVVWNRIGDEYLATDLGTLGGEFSHALGINALGQVLGGAQPAGVPTSSNGHATLWSWNSSSYMPIDLGVPLGGQYAWAQGANASGQIVGASQIPGPRIDEPYRATLWSWNGSSYQATDLGTMGGTFSAALGINATGRIAGYSRLPGDSTNYPVYWSWNGSSYSISTLSVLQGEANGINDAGQIVGTLVEFDRNAPGSMPIVRGVIWNWNGSGYDPTYLGQVGTEPALTYAYDINSFGQVVGVSAGRAFSYVDGATFDLNEFTVGADGRVLGEALGINDFGQIVGYASPMDGTNDHHAFLLTPIPEPAESAALMGGLILALLIYLKLRV